MLILKAISQRNNRDFKCPCDGPHVTPESATWELDVQFVGKVRLCTAHYREFTAWECGNERKCNHVNHGMGSRCVCGWVRPDTCRKCGEVSYKNLIKITEKREPHPCHACNGIKKEVKFVTCACGGNPIVGTSECVTCWGTGRTYETAKEAKCQTCDGLGKQSQICKTCKGSCEVLAVTDVKCIACAGSGTCSASDSNFGVDRIPLTDILPAHREKLAPYVGQYLCWKCANVDFQFSSYREGDEELQCFHYDNLPNGEIERCTQKIAKNNPSKIFCFMHLSSHHCEVCNEKLKLDEWGRRCKAHRKCARCDEKPYGDFMFCIKHMEYQKLGQMLEKTNEHVPESPIQILLAEEKVSLSRDAMRRRRTQALSRSQKGAEELRDLEKARDIIFAKDSAESKAKMAEIYDLEYELKKGDSPDLQAELQRLKKEVDEAREFQDRVNLRVIERRMVLVDDRIKEDLSVYMRCRQIGAELLSLIERLKCLRHYELWDPKSNPEYVAQPDPKYDVQCKSCNVVFDRRTPFKYLCPNCTTVSEIEVRAKKLKALPPEDNKVHCKKCDLDFAKPVGKRICPGCSTEVELTKDEERRKKKEESRKGLEPMVYGERRAALIDSIVNPEEPAIVVKIAMPTDNTPTHDRELNLVCEVCRQVVPEVKPVKLAIRDRYGSETVVPFQVYFCCPSCKYTHSQHGVLAAEARRRDLEKELLEKELLEKELDHQQIEHAIKTACTEVMDKWHGREPVRYEPLGKRPAPFPIPPIRSISSIEKERKEAKDKEFEKSVGKAMERFKELLTIVEPTPQEVSEMAILRTALSKKYSDADIPKAQTTLVRDVPQAWK